MSDHTPKVKKAITVYLEDEEMDMLDTLRVQNYVTWDRQQMIAKLIRRRWEEVQSEGSRPAAKEPVRQDESRFGFGPLVPHAVVTQGGWRAPVSTYVPGFEWPPHKTEEQRRAEQQAEDLLDSLHDLVDAVVELSHGPVTVTAEAPIDGGGTYKMHATVDFTVKPVVSDD